MRLRRAPERALVLTAGLGTRLRPLTAARAKPVLPVAGLTLIERILGYLHAAGLREVLLNLHYLPATITAVVGDGSSLGLSVRYSWEMPLLGSGGGPRRAFSLVSDDRLWLVNGDTLTDVDLGAMADAHARSSALVTMALIPNPSPERYGGVTVTESGEITGFVPRGTPGPSWHFVGVQIAERAAFAPLADGIAADSVGPLYRALIADGGGAIRAFRTAAQFFDIGTPRDYLHACLAFNEGRTVIGPGSTVDGSAELDACVLWEGVTVGRNACLSHTIVCDGAVVPEGYRASDVVVMRAGELTAGGAGTIGGAWPLQSFPIV